MTFNADTTPDSIQARLVALRDALDATLAIKQRYDDPAAYSADVPEFAGLPAADQRAMLQAAADVARRESGRIHAQLMDAEIEMLRAAQEALQIIEEHGSSATFDAVTGAPTLADETANARLRRLAARVQMASRRQASLRRQLADQIDAEAGTTSEE